MNDKNACLKKILKIAGTIAAIKLVIDIFIAGYRKKTERIEKETVDTKDPKYSAVTTARHINCEGQTFNSITIRGLCAGIDVDLGGMKIKDELFLECKNTMSGISIIVPENVRVEVKSHSVMAGILNETKDAGEDAPVIHVLINSFMGGTSIRNRKEQDTQDIKEEKE